MHILSFLFVFSVLQSYIFADIKWIMINEENSLESVSSKFIGAENGKVEVYICRVEKEGSIFVGSVINEECRVSTNETVSESKEFFNSRVYFKIYREKNYEVLVNNSEEISFTWKERTNLLTPEGSEFNSVFDIRTEEKLSICRVNYTKMAGKTRVEKRKFFVGQELSPQKSSTFLDESIFGNCFFPIGDEGRAFPDYYYVEENNEPVNTVLEQIRSAIIGIGKGGSSPVVEFLNIQH